MSRICLPLHAEAALDLAARPTVEARIREVCEILLADSADLQRFPPLLVLLVDEQYMAAKLGVPALPGLPSRGNEIADGYVLDGLRLREIFGFLPIHAAVSL